jgi:hypothetical protein
VNVELYLNGAFFIGVGLRSAALLTGDYEQTQGRVRAELGGSAGEWRYDRISDESSALRFSVKGQHASLIPVSFMSWRGSAARQRLLDRLQEKPLNDTAAAAWARLRIEIAEVDIDMFDIGVGVLAVRARVLETDLELRRLRADVEELSSGLVSVLNELIAETVREFACGLRASIPELVLEVPWFQEEGSVSGLPRDRGAVARPLGLTASSQLLWLHRCYILDECMPEHKCELDVLLPSVYKQDRLGEIDFLPGIGSTVIARHGLVDNADRGLLSVSNLLALMNQQWAYIATAMEIDRTLFRRLHQFTVNARSARPSDVEREAQTVLALNDQVRVFRAATNSVLIDLGGGTRWHWNLMAEVQSLPEIFEAVDDKLGALQDACEALRTQASIKRQRRVASTVDVFAGFGVVASVAGVAAFIVDMSLDAPTLNRVLIAAITLAVVMGALITNWLAHGTVGTRSRRHPELWRESNQ